MNIVELNDLPTADKIVDVPLDDPLAVYKVCQELQELCKRENGIGISAVQVGIPWKLFLVKGDGTWDLVPAGTFRYFVNCSYKGLTEEKQIVSLEGCLSLRSPDGRLRSFQVERFSTIHLSGLILQEKESKVIFEKVEADVNVRQQGIVLQHEIDHQLGHEGLISHIGKEVFIW